MSQNSCFCGRSYPGFSLRRYTMISPTCRESKLGMAKPFPSFWQPNCCPLWNTTNKRVVHDGQTGILSIRRSLASPGCGRRRDDGDQGAVAGRETHRHLPEAGSSSALNVLDGGLSVPMSQQVWVKNAIWNEATASMAGR